MTEVSGRGRLLSAREGDQQWAMLRVPGMQVRFTPVAGAGWLADNQRSCSWAPVQAARPAGSATPQLPPAAALAGTRPRHRPWPRTFPVSQEGCHLLEAQHGPFVSAPAPFLVVDDEEAVGELRQLELPGCSATAGGAELLQRLGAVLRFAARHAEGTAAPALVSRMAAAAQELAAACILYGWGAVLRLVLPTACLGCTPQQAVAAMQAHLCGIPLLHAAALTGGARAVRALGSWAAVAGYELRLDAPWGGGLTPLHVATLLREPEAVALALTGALQCRGLHAAGCAAVCAHCSARLLLLLCPPLLPSGHLPCTPASPLQTCARSKRPSCGPLPARSTAPRRRWAWPAACASCRCWRRWLRTAC